MQQSDHTHQQTVWHFRDNIGLLIRRASVKSHPRRAGHTPVDARHGRRCRSHHSATKLWKPTCVIAAASTGSGTAASRHGRGGAGGRTRMGLLSRYVFRQTAGALLLILISLTGVTWIAIALRQLELMTTQGQDVMRFLGMTTLAIPGLLAFIAPVALLIASIHVLNKLNGDSELIVMTAGGMPVWSLLKPLGLLALLVSLSVAAVNHVAGPWSQRTLKDLVVQVRTDFMSQVLQPWRFSSPEAKLTVHIRDRAAERRSARPAAARCARSQAGRHLPRRARADHQAGSGRLPAHGEGPRAAPARERAGAADHLVPELSRRHEPARAACRHGAGAAPARALHHRAAAPGQE